MSSTMPPKNYHLAKVAVAKRVEIPFTINGGAVAAITATIDDELTNSAEIFVANSAGAAQDGIVNVAGQLPDEVRFTDKVTGTPAIYI